MLSLPGIRGVFRSLDGRSRHHDHTSAVAVDPEPPRDRAGDAYLVWLATYLELDLLAVIRVDNGKSGEIQAAGKSGLASDLTMPQIDQGGALGRLVLKARPERGRGKIFTTGEVFPLDGSWCDFVPMDSSTAFSFMPVAALPGPGQATRHSGATRSTFVLGADLGLAEADRILEIKTSLAASLLAPADGVGDAVPPEAIPSWFDHLLAEEGYALAVADSCGLRHIAGRSDWATGPEEIAEIRREIQALEGTLEPGMAPVEITPQERAGRKITIYPGAAGDGLDCLVVVKRISEDPDTHSRREWLNLLGRFTSSIAHEIKNPLTGIAAGVQYLAKRLQPGAAEADTVDFILTEIARLNRIVDDLYKIARPPQLVLTRTALNSVVTKSLFCLSEEVVRKRLRVEQSLQPDMPAFDADPERLQQVIINIIKNAIEASAESGTIEIATHAGEGRVTVQVTDRGPGIPPGERARIFEPFYSTKKGGTGLGLCISQAIIEEHGGRISIESPLKGGARFVVEIPIAKSQGA